MTRKPSSVLTEPVRLTGSALRRLPGAGVVGRAAEGTLDTIGAVSPRGRRIAVYTGAGLLGVAGVVEWPVAVAGAAVAWLTQPKPGQQEQRATRTGTGGPSTGASVTTSGGRTQVSGGPAQVSGATTAAGNRTTAARPKAVHGTGTTTIKAATAHQRTAARRRTAAMGRTDPNE
ncbi:hypothetical protein [Streptomyces sp.]|uniref:hypothetical protein n=1 Tax=Streptomyces sp. TaxID=1931 RepID=UPI002D40E4D4|nr:hypothetical protein [Streptomyces sp.]HZF89329.1 hypothetical protein [Streptomyces sp.]